MADEITGGSTVSKESLEAEFPGIEVITLPNDMKYAKFDHVMIASHTSFDVLREQLTDYFTRRQRLQDEGSVVDERPQWTTPIGVPGPGCNM
jgi:hypothetical protein